MPDQLHTKDLEQVMNASGGLNRIHPKCDYSVRLEGSIALMSTDFEVIPKCYPHRYPQAYPPAFKPWTRYPWCRTLDQPPHSGRSCSQDNYHGRSACARWTGNIGENPTIEVAFRPERESRSGLGNVSRETGLQTISNARADRSLPDPMVWAESLRDPCHQGTYPQSYPQ